MSTRAGRALEPVGGHRHGARARRPRARADALPARCRQPYLLYLGRVDRNKGCDTLLEYFPTTPPRTRGCRWCWPVRQDDDSGASAHSRARPRQRRRTRRAAAERARRWWCRRRSRASASCCWKAGIAACRRSSTATARCLKGQVRRANGGLYYRSSAEFERSGGDAAGRRRRAPRPGRAGAGLRGARVSLADRDGASRALLDETRAARCPGP